ncbi:MAG: aromatic ring-hydroxylating dioxygenase subunit alpha [Gammaproteobacteria bacterium]|nr:aromatic ring-hydroxylating dioxygenase subunit alpha [Gammaproteobacteria bacterium]
MDVSSEHWYPVLRSRELRDDKPTGRTRFGEALVFWRDAAGTPVVMADRCPHRGAALSRGRLRDHELACPFHGFRFASDGRCTRTPPEGDRPVPADLRAATHTATEAHGYIWMWRGAPQDPAELPAPPHHEAVLGMSYGESVSMWPAHYTRCIENVCDFSHLPVVHRTTIGLFKSEAETVVDVETIPGGLRGWLMEDGRRTQCFEFIYPNLWSLQAERSALMSAVFVPVDESTTEVYGRTYTKANFPGLRPLLDLYTRFSQFLVFREDWPVVASQDPGDIRNIRSEKLLSSDAPILAYRKMHYAHTRSAQETTS